MKLVQADIVLELANGPVNETAYNYLTKKGIIVVPDVLANAGGVVVSYLEWLQNRTNESWDEAKVNTKLEKYIVAAMQEAYAYTKTKNVSLKEAAFALAIQRIIQAKRSK